MILLALAAAVPPSNNALIAGLVIGIPSVTIALASYWLSTRASQSTQQAARQKVDAEAYTRAQSSYESHIADLRQQVEDLHADVARVKLARDTALSDLEETRAELRRAQRKLTRKRHELDNLDPG